MMDYSMPAKFTLVIGVWLLVGCASTLRDTPVEINELIFTNNTPAALDEVTLRIPNTNGVVSCGFIPAGETCSTKFPNRQYQGNAITIAWKQSGISHSSPESIIPIPANLSANVPLRAMISIQADQSASAWFTQANN